MRVDGDWVLNPVFSTPKDGTTAVNTVIRTLDQLYLGNTMTQWWWALTIFGATLLAGLLLKRIVKYQYQRMAKTPELELMEMPFKIISRTANTFLIIISVFAALQSLVLTEKVQHIADKVLLIAICWQVGLWVSTAAMSWLEHRRQFKLQQDRATAGSLNIISVVLRVAIWVVVLLLTLDNLGINITTLVAGLGIGGIAVALAVQNVLGDLLASLSITLDKPFVVGDALTIDDIQGTVEQIGLKSTRLRSVNGEQIIMANADLLKSRVRNFGRLNERRAVMTLQVAYDTPAEKLPLLAEEIRKLVAAKKKVRLDRCHLSKLGVTAIEFETVYFVETADYGTFMDIQQAINLDILSYCTREGIRFAAAVPQLILREQ